MAGGRRLDSTSDSGFRCPICTGAMGVKDSRPTENGHCIRRRRQCVRCAHRITTYEIIFGEDQRILALSSFKDELDAVVGEYDAVSKRLDGLRRFANLLEGMKKRV